MNWNPTEIAALAEKLTIELVNVYSVNGTEGEAKVGEKIESLVRKIPYFAEHPEQVWLKYVDQDELKRRSVFAFLPSEAPSDRTIILHAHSDTVTIEDFGSLQEYATQPAELKEQLKQLRLAPEIMEDLHSDDWLFGRGSVDMKSGMAIHIALLTYFAENRGDFTGNLLFMANPIEETTHGGIIDALPELERVQKDKQLTFNCAINTDFVGPLYKGDEKRYMYLGSVGKLLPAFYIRGSETHVGQAFEGLDPNYLAAELIQRINLNPDLADELEGEWTQPPVTLKAKDLKPTYNVQTPIASFVYFNYYVHKISPDEIFDQLRKVAQESFESVLTKMNTDYELFCERTKHPYNSIDWLPIVKTYDELYDEVISINGKAVTNAEIKKVLERNKQVDPREVGRLIVEALLDLHTEKTPVIVLFFATPYVPRNYVKGQDANEQQILSALNQVLTEVGNEMDEEFVVGKFFPSLTDSSYLCLDDTDAEIAYLKNNFPGMDTLYPVPIQTIRKLNVPALNMGSWGKDAHKMTERVYRPYTFGVLPTVIYEYCKKILK